MAPRPTAPRSRLKLGLLVAALVVLADQLVKLWVLAALGSPSRSVEVAPFFDLTLVWNRGISFGLLSRGEGVSPWLFAGVALAVSLALAVWLRRIRRPWLAAAVGLVIGGALGNVIDRLRFAAVVDFLDFHAGGYHWPAFNLADAAISGGAIFLLIDALLGPRKGPR